MTRPETDAHRTAFNLVRMMQIETSATFESMRWFFEVRITPEDFDKGLAVATDEGWIEDEALTEAGKAAFPEYKTVMWMCRG